MSHLARLTNPPLRTPARGETSRCFLVGRQQSSWTEVAPAGDALRPGSPGDRAAVLQDEASVRQRGVLDECCGGAEDGSLTHDLMGFGMQMNPWHAYVWKEVWEGLGTTPEGDAIPATGWVEQMA